MSKDIWEAAHEQLIQEYLDQNPDASWGGAAAKTEHLAEGRAQDNMAHAAEAARMRAEDNAAERADMEYRERRMA